MITLDKLNFYSALITAIATGAIGYFTFTLKRSTDNLWRSGEKQIKISSQMTDVAEKQLAIIGLQTDIQRKQHAIGRLQFIAAHRPLLRVRYFKLLSDGKEPIQVAFTVANVGTGAANLLGSRVAIEFFSPNAIPTPFYQGGEDITGTRKFEPGATDEYRIGRSGNREYAQLMWTQEGMRLYIFGLLIYADDNDGTRTTAFCRGWNADRDRFDPVNDSDYEYED
jgi:hypothetical protein